MRGKYSDLTGLVYGAWKVLQRAPTRKHPSGQRSTMWLCRCLKCGRERPVKAATLVREYMPSRSCGCEHYRSNIYQVGQELYDQDGKPYLRLVGRIKKKKRKAWLVQCLRCNRPDLVPIDDSHIATQKSCGCLRRAIGEKALRRTHGMRSTKEWRAWRSMKQRCYNPSQKSFKYVGARGIAVCHRWRDSFENFLEDMGKCPVPNWELIRKDMGGDFEPSNCIWAMASSKRRSNVEITVHGEVLNLAQASRIFKIPYKTLHKRLGAGWSVEAALETVPRNGGSPRSARKINRIY